MRRRILWVAALILAAPPSAKSVVAQPPYALGVHTDTGNDTLMQGVEGAILFSIDAEGDPPAAAFTWALTLTYSHETLIGPVVDSFWQVVNPAAVVNVYHTKRQGNFSQNLRPRFYATNPDTVLLGALYYLGGLWQGTGEQWRIVFTPPDTGLIVIDTTAIWPYNHLSALSSNGTPYPVTWQARTIHVVPYCPTGDANSNSEITSADAIYLVNHVFKNGPAPVPCSAYGDVNCTGTLTSADIIILLNYIFRAGPRPCYACALVEQGVWECP